MSTGKILKKCTSSILAITLMFTALAHAFAVPDNTNEPTPAESEEITDNKGKISINYLGIGNAPADENQGKAGLTIDNRNNVFWIGVAISNFSDLAIIKNGVFTLELAFDYNPNYVKPFDSKDKPWAQNIKEGNIKSGEGIDNQSDLWWTDENYMVASAVTDIGVNTNPLRENVDEALQNKNNGWKSCFASITSKTDINNSGLRFLNTTSQKESYILKLPFVLVSAPEDGQAPIVIKMSLGPETFVISSGADGTDPCGAWESEIKNDEEEDADNLKTMFDFNGDINLFGGSDELENLEVYKGNLEEDEEETKYLLSQTSELDEDGFLPDEYEYYLRVPNETESLRLVITANEEPDVSLADVSADVMPVSGGETTQFEATVPLNEFNSEIRDGFSDDIVITSGLLTYHVYVQRLLKPKIILNYGNSPYAEIKKNISEEDREEAINKFTEGNTFRGLDEKYIPEGMNKSSNFSPEAWIGEYDLESLSEEEQLEIRRKIADPSVNMDRNDDALFIYNESSFMDTGFRVIDSFGKTVSEDDIKKNLVRTITVQQMTGANIQGLVGEYISKPVTIENKESNCLIDGITEPGDSIVPGIYTMNYTYVDHVSEQTAVNQRPIVVLWELGDADMTADVNVSDPGAVYSVVNGLVNILTDSTPEEEIPFRTQVQNLFLFRIVDADTSGQVNVSDPGGVYNIVNGIVAKRIYKESK